MRVEYSTDDAQRIATRTQAYEAQSVASQAIATTIRSQTSTEAALTTGTRANKATTSGSRENDLFLESDTGWLWRWTGTAWAFLTGLYIATEATRAALTIAVADNGAVFYAEDTGILWKVEAGAWANKFDVLDVLTEFRVNGVKVVGAQGAAVADAAGGVTVDAEARTALNALLSRLRAHGLIA